MPRPKGMARFVFHLVFLVVLSPAGAIGQNNPPSPARHSGRTPNLDVLRKAITQRSARFLGWKFAAKYARSTSEWQRNASRPARTYVAGAISRPIPQSVSSSQGATSFVNAGFDFRTGPPTGFIPTAVVAGDFNEDGHMDLAISNGGDNTVYVLLGNGDGTFRTPEVLYTRGESPVWITAADLQNNGHLDLAVADGDTDTVEIFLGKGDGTFQPGAQVSLSQTPTFLLAGDFNHDGNQDLVVGLVVDVGAAEPQFELLLGDGTGGFSGAVFPPPITVIEPTPTGWIAAADLNNDGFTDLVTTVTAGSAMTYLNQNGQSFLQGSPFGPSDGAMVVGLGDMDEDGCVDAVELGEYGFVTIAKGTCDGNFTQSAPIAAVGDLDPAIQVIDVNGDGHLDVVGSSAYYGLETAGMGAQGGYLVSVLKGDGKGNLAPAQIYRGGADDFSLAVADLTGDGMPEIVTTDSLDNAATLFVNDGSGNYGAPGGESIGYLSGVTNSPIPDVPMETADLNGDGKPDIVLLEFGQLASDPSQFTALLNDGTGNFLPPIRSPVTAGPNVPYPQFILGDFRNPSKADVAYITMYAPSNIVAFVPGNGDGTFGPAQTLTTLSNPLQLVAGDFNNDGELDFVVVGTDAGQTNWEFDVFLGHGDGTFTHLPSQKFPYLNGGTPQQLIAVDLNHDGKLDLLIGNNDNGGLTVTGDDLIEALGNGDGTFQAPTTLIPHFGPVVVGDLNHDGLPDLVQERDPYENTTGEGVFIPAAVTIYLGTASGGFQQQPSYDLPGFIVPSFYPPPAGDFNGDGAIDVAVRFYTAPTVLTGARLRILQGNGDGTFAVTNHTDLLPALSDPSLGADFNGDGATDLMELVGFTSSFHTIPAGPWPSLDISFDSSPIVGTAGSATVTLDQPATSAETVILSASDPAVQLPSVLTFNTGQSTQSFSFSLGSGFDATHALGLYAMLGTETAVAYAAEANSNFPVGVAASMSPSSDSTTPGGTASVALQLASQQGYSGTFSSFQCSGLPPGATCSFAANSLFVPPGETAGVGITVSTSSSTPLGTYSVSASATDGQVQAIGQVQLGIGDFSLNMSPNPVVTGPTANALPTVTSTSSNGLGGSITLSCSGLPVSVQCGQAGNILMANGGSTVLAVDPTQAIAGDYPFTVMGTLNNVSHQISALLRVGDFTASLDNTAATLAAGQSATFKVTLASVNHYASTISIFCQPSSQQITCTASPATANLTDGGTASVQLTITAPSSAAISVDPLFFSAPALLCMAILLCMSIQPRRAVAVRVVLATALLAGVAGCGSGGGGAGGGGAGGGSGAGGNPPPPTPQTINVSVTASAAVTQNDLNNQKILGPIVITLD
jgi:hypothetical protein